MSAIYQSAPLRVIKYATVRVDWRSAASTSSAVDMDGRRTPRWRRVISRPIGPLSTATVPTAPVDTAGPDAGREGRRVGVPGRIRRLCFDENDDIEPSTISVRSSAVLLLCNNGHAVSALQRVLLCTTTVFVVRDRVQWRTQSPRANNNRPLSVDTQISVILITGVTVYIYKRTPRN